MFNKDYVACRHYGEVIQLTEPLSWEGQGYTIQIPTNFKSDGATNYGLHFIIRRFGPNLRAALVHDYVLSKGWHWGLSAKLFYHALLDCGCSKWRAKLIYWGVMAFGKAKNL